MDVGRLSEEPNGRLTLVRRSCVALAEGFEYGGERPRFKTSPPEASFPVVASLAGKVQLTVLPMLYRCD